MPKKRFPEETPRSRGNLYPRGLESVHPEKYLTEMKQMIKMAIVEEEAPEGRKKTDPNR